MLRLTLISYNLALSCLASRGLGAQAQDLLQRMRLRGVHPDVISINTVLNAWATSKLVDETVVARVEALVDEEVMGNSKRSTSSTIVPNARTFSIWLKTIAASRLAVPDKRKKAEQVVLVMTKHGFEPNDRDLQQLELAVTGSGNSNSSGSRKNRNRRQPARP
jgi:pentatricopeptide repeat protein